MQNLGSHPHAPVPFMRPHCVQPLIPQLSGVWLRSTSCHLHGILTHRQTCSRRFRHSAHAHSSHSHSHLKYPGSCSLSKYQPSDSHHNSLSWFRSSRHHRHRSHRNYYNRCNHRILAPRGNCSVCKHHHGSNPNSPEPMGVTARAPAASLRLLRDITSAMHHRS